MNYFFTITTSNCYLILKFPNIEEKWVLILNGEMLQQILFWYVFIITTVFLYQLKLWKEYPINNLGRYLKLSDYIAY